ncbi:hypothetical protein [Natronomonas sp. LN261]|jgi:hypothetical protein|uniref:DUF7535 family protein n=1 Tax=Natronomonas sp. LN261 TaxID=2750669 RepID=UPI0015EFC140|nr:hypothetical protein [Natronomonas sp. LN261]
MIRDITVRRLRGVVHSIRTSEGEDDQLANPKIAAAAGILVVLLPLVPFFAVVWMISKTLEGVRQRVSWE